MMRLSLLFFATSLISACGSSEEGSPENTTEAPVENSSEASTEKDGDAWTLTGDGIPEIDEAGAQKTATGLTIIATKEGTGAAPKEGDVVAVHYHGWLAQDGKQFDSSAKRGEPITFPLGQGRVIPGWDEGVAALKVGGKARLRIPYNLAYGDSGRPPVIPEKADLVFDVWLVDIWSQPADSIPERDESKVETSPTGLSKVVFSEGKGEPVGASMVSVHYHGWLASTGALFDSSARAGRPLTFPVGVGMVIPGWDEGIADMKVGEKARLRIPAALAYGENSPGEQIPANSDLVFDVWVMGAKEMPQRGMPAGHP